MNDTVLLVEYSEYEREKTKIAFDNIGVYNFIEVDNIVKLQEAISAFPPLTLIVMDISFPIERDGLAALSLLRKDSSTVDVPIIIITKPDNINHRHSVQKFGVQDFIVKPYKTKRLENSIRSILNIPQSFRYELDSANVITMSIEDYVAKEFKLASRANKSLSIILITPSVSKKKGVSENETAPNLREKVYAIATEKVRLISRTTDTALLNDNKDILVILPFTDTTGAQRVLEKFKIGIDKELGDFNIKYDDCF